MTIWKRIKRVWTVPITEKVSERTAPASAAAGRAGPEAG